MSGPGPPYALHVEILEGHGPPVVFLPGIGATTRYWRSRIAPLARRASPVLVDLLGFGKSPKPRIRYSVDRHLDSLEPVLRAEGRPVIVGHSLGAVLALALAVRRPRLVRGLILLSLPVFDAEQDTVLGFRKGRSPGGWIARNMVLTATACILMRRVAGRVLPLVVRDMPRDIVEDLLLHTWRSSTSSLWEVIYRHDVSTDALGLSADIPVHLLHGDRDGTAPVDKVLDLARRRADWRMQVLPGVDHHPLLQASDASLRFIEEALGAIYDGPPRPSHHPLEEENP